MGFIVDPSSAVPDFAKAVISVWFRVPQASIDAAVADFNDFMTTPQTGPLVDTFAGVIPLLTFGPNAPIAIASGDSINYGSTSMIGIFCGPASDMAYNCTNIDQSGNCALMFTRLQYNSFSNSMTTYSMGDFFLVGGMPAPFFGWNTWSAINVVADVWHHFLISFDTTGSLVFSMAYDDVNYDGWYLGPFIDASYSGSGTPGLFSKNFLQDPSNIGSGPLPISGHPVGVPAAADYSSHIRKVEMAELQIFTGVTLDTSITANRRAFIDASGKPVSPKYSRASDGTVTAAADSPPYLLLGQLPDMALCQSSGNWTAGKNLGSATTHFAKTGTVKSFTPDPKLGT